MNQLPNWEEGAERGRGGGVDLPAKGNLGREGQKGHKIGQNTLSKDDLYAPSKDRAGTSHNYVSQEPSQHTTVLYLTLSWM